MRIFAALAHYEELCVCQLTELLQVTGATVSKHLSLLSRSGLIKNRKEGRWIFYRHNRTQKDINEVLESLMPKIRSSAEALDDLVTLEKITALPKEDLCRKQRGEACCPRKS